MTVVGSTAVCFFATLLAACNQQPNRDRAVPHRAKATSTAASQATVGSRSGDTCVVPPPDPEVVELLRRRLNGILNRNGVGVTAVNDTVDRLVHGLPCDTLGRRHRHVAGSVVIDYVYHSLPLLQPPSSLSRQYVNGIPLAVSAVVVDRTDESMADAFSWIPGLIEPRLYKTDRKAEFLVTFAPVEWVGLMVSKRSFYQLIDVEMQHSVFTIGDAIFLPDAVRVELTSEWYRELQNARSQPTPMP